MGPRGKCAAAPGVARPARMTRRLRWRSSHGARRSVPPLRGQADPDRSGRAGGAEDGYHHWPSVTNDHTTPEHASSPSTCTNALVESGARELKAIAPTRSIEQRERSLPVVFAGLQSIPVTGNSLVTNSASWSRLESDCIACPADAVSGHVRRDGQRLPPSEAVTAFCPSTPGSVLAGKTSLEQGGTPAMTRAARC